MSSYSKIKRIINNDYIYSLIVRITCIILGVAYSVLFSRFFGAELKGQSAVIINYATIFDTLLSLGIYHAYPFYKKKNEENIYNEYLNNTITLFLIYQTIGILLAVFLPVDLKFKIAIALFPLLSGTRYINYAILVEYPKRRNTTFLIQNIVEILVILVSLLFFKPLLEVMIIVVIVKEAITFLISLVSTFRSPFQYRFTLGKIPTYVKFGFISMIAGMLVTLNYRIDILMLNGNVSDADIGIYSVGVNLAEKIWLIPDIIKNILISHLSKGKGEDEVAKVLRVSTLLSLIAIGLVALLGRFFIDLFYGEEYDGAYIITLLLLIGVIGMVYQRIVYSYNIVNGKRIINLVFLGAAVVANVILNLIFIPHYGIRAAALSSVVSYSICGILFITYFWVKTRIPIYKVLLIQKEDVAQFISFFRRTNHEN